MFEEIMAMAEESREMESSRQGNKVVDRFGGSLVNIILGALILWVGQTTFQHAGKLAGVDERFQGVDHQFNAVNGRHDSLRQRLERSDAETNQRTRSRFTQEDGERLEVRVKEVHDVQAQIERQLIERITRVQLKLIALETSGNNLQELRLLRAEVESWRASLAQQLGAAYYGGANPAAGRATAPRPTYLPAVTQHR